MQNPKNPETTNLLSLQVSAVQEKNKLEAQMKQLGSQKSMMEKTLEKKDALESKKRESIMVVSVVLLAGVGYCVRGAGWRERASEACKRVLPGLC